jgi:hypothetical protein
LGCISSGNPQVGVTHDETFFSGNVGGGVKWYAPNNRWGCAEIIAYR